MRIRGKEAERGVGVGVGVAEESEERIEQWGESMFSM